MTAALPQDGVATDWTPGRMRFQLAPEVERYLLDHSTVYGAAGVALVRDTVALGDPAVMLLAPEQYSLLRFLTGLVGARRALDLGTFTGLSALAFAEAMGPDGHVLTVDRNAGWVAMARSYWQLAGVDDRIETRIGEASDVLAALPRHEHFDIAFIDVDKACVHHYVEATLQVLAPRGIIVVDNVLWHGWVMDPDRQDADTQGMRELNDRIAADPALEVAMVPVGDGVRLIRRRG
jgi:caffeoyl-CoA O-methyltransferase